MPMLNLVPVAAVSVSLALWAVIIEAARHFGAPLVLGTFALLLVLVFLEPAPALDGEPTEN
jgi:hypothetical protein